MKQFAVYARVRLIEQPDWLDRFRAKYHQHYDFHVTLKQPCNVSDSEVPEVCRRFDEFFARYRGGPLAVNFNDLIIDGPTEVDACMMILAAPNPDLIDLQRDVVALYGEFRDYRKPQLATYERNFRPHLTIIHDLEPDEFRQAQADVKDDVRCLGAIEDVVLAVVNDATIEEALNPKNLTVARL